MRSTLILLASLVACDADVRDPDETSQTIPGCTFLVERPEAIVVPDSRGGQLVAIDGVDVGLVYAYDPGTTPGSVRSRRLLDPFGTWPPTLGEEAFHLDGPNPYLDAVARADGTFVLRRAAEPGTEYSIGTFGQEGAWPTRPGRPVLEPSPGVGVYWHHEGELQFFATLDAEAPLFSLPLPAAEPDLPSPWVHGLDRAGQLVIRGADGFFTVADDALTPFAPLPSGDSGTSPAWLFPAEEGGVWYARDEPEALELHRLGAQPLAASLFSNDYVAGLQRTTSPWGAGRGVVALEERWIPEGGTPLGFELIVTDGEHQTRLTSDVVTTPYSVVSSPDGSSILVGTGGGFVVRRFDCVSLD